MKKHYFISGLPRSGSTLLTSILNQNPKFHSNISGPLARFIRAIINESSAQGGYRFQCPEDTRKQIIYGIFENYYKNIEKEVIFDTNRGWTLLLPLLKDLFPDTKVICCVRDIQWILDSFENLIRNNPYTVSNIYSPEQNISVYSRVNAMMQENMTLGFAYIALKQAITSKENSMLYIMEYDNLCKFPEKTMKSIYKFLGEEYYEHDFNNVGYSYSEFDSDMNMNNLHEVRNKVEYKQRKCILPYDIINSLKGLEVWK